MLCEMENLLLTQQPLRLRARAIVLGRTRPGLGARLVWQAQAASTYWGALLPALPSFPPVFRARSGTSEETAIASLEPVSHWKNSVRDALLARRPDGIHSSDHAVRWITRLGGR